MYNEEECLRQALDLSMHDAHQPSASEYQFQYEFDHGDWRAFDSPQNAILEEAMSSGLPGAHIQIGHNIYEIIFQDGIQRNMQSGTVRRVRWRPLGSARWLPVAEGEGEETRHQAQCHACTFLNPASARACGMCGTVICNETHGELSEEAGMYVSGSPDASFMLGGAALGAAVGGLISYARRQDVTTGLLQGASAGIIGGSLAQAAAMTFSNEAARQGLVSSASSSSSHRVQTSAIPTHRLAGNEHEKMGECVICLQNFSRGDVVKRLPCLHSFHESCIDIWLKKGSHVCPICKTDISNFFSG